MAIDLGGAPKMPVEGTTVAVREGEAEQLAAQTLDEDTEGIEEERAALADEIRGKEGVVRRAAHTNGDVQIGDHLIFGYGAQFST